MYEGVEVKLHTFLTSALEDEWPAFAHTASTQVPNKQKSSYGVLNLDSCWSYGKSHQYPPDSWLGGLQSQFECGDEERSPCP